MKKDLVLIHFKMSWSNKQSKILIQLETKYLKLNANVASTNYTAQLSKFF